MEELGQFIWKAKKSTYSADGDVYEKDGMSYFSFRDGFFRFEDRKIGSQYYSGQEVVYEEDEPIWTMAYSGGLLTDSVPAEQIYHFLKESLLKEEQRNILRGPSFYQREQLFYLNEFEGDLDRFHGREYIRVQGKIIYELHYSGGYLTHEHKTDV